MLDYLKNIENAEIPSGLPIKETTTLPQKVKISITKDPQSGTTYLEPRKATVKRFVLKK